jgi:hypothetical protein
MKAEDCGFGQSWGFWHAFFVLCKSLFSKFLAGFTVDLAQPCNRCYLGHDNYHGHGNYRGHDNHRDYGNYRGHEKYHARDKHYDADDDHHDH